MAYRKGSKEDLVLTQMVQKIDQWTEQLNNKMEDSNHSLNSLEDKTPTRLHKPKIFWRNVCILSFLHISFLYGLRLAFTKAMWQTNLFACLLYVLTKIGVGAGVHRLWSHKSYKAKLPLRALLMLLFTMAFEGKVWVWARDHRVHHKYQETDADPYNAERGLWFSHMGWLLQSKHPDVIEKGKGIDMSDLRGDSLVMFQKRHYWPITLVVAFLLPTAIPVYCWGETWMTAWFVAVCLRLVVGHHGTWTINSFAHTYGTHPYDKNFMAAENSPLVYITLGEGWHNYHHAFPWDYRTSEMGFQTFNITKGFIDWFAMIGWAYDLKTASREVVYRRALRTGDGSHPAHQEKEVWGWGDGDLTEEDRLGADVINRKLL